MLMNQLPEHLLTPLTPRPFAPSTSSIPDYLFSGQTHLHLPSMRPFVPPSLPDFMSAPPDLLYDETLLLQPVLSRGEPTAFSPVSPLRAPSHPGPELFVRAGSPMSYQPSPSPTSSHVTNPEGGNRVHLAEHQASDCIVYSRADLPRNLPVRLYFLRRFRHTRKPGLRGQVSRLLIRIEETSPGAFCQWQIALTLSDYIFEDFGNALTIIAQCNGEEAILLSFPIATSMAWVHQGVFSNGIQRPLQLIDHLEQCYLPSFVSRPPSMLAASFIRPATAFPAQTIPLRPPARLSTCPPPSLMATF
jgi:hypothetical protein